MLKKFEDKIDELLLTIIRRSYISDELPAKLGGLGFQYPSEEAEFEYQNSIMVITQLTNTIYNQLSYFDIDDE